MGISVQLILAAASTSATLSNTANYFLLTFFNIKTGPQYSMELYKQGAKDYLKFDAVFTVRRSYTAPFRVEVKEWVKNNIEKWKAEKKDWFDISMIPDEFLPAAVLEAEEGEPAERASRSNTHDFCAPYKIDRIDAKNDAVRCHALQGIRYIRG